MRIIINNSSMKPIYEQIMDQIKAMVLEGTLAEQTALPSVRLLAKDLQISALTVKKAYDALEEEGFVITIHGKGSYIAPATPNLLQEERRKAVESKMELLIREALGCGMKKSEIQQVFELIMEEI